MHGNMYGTVKWNYDVGFYMFWLLFSYSPARRYCQLHKNCPRQQLRALVCVEISISALVVHPGVNHGDVPAVREDVPILVALPELDTFVSQGFVILTSRTAEVNFRRLWFFILSKRCFCFFPQFIALTSFSASWGSPIMQGTSLERIRRILNRGLN